MWKDVLLRKNTSLLAQRGISHDERLLATSRNKTRKLLFLNE
jgi:hypothetical protein